MNKTFAYGILFALVIFADRVTKWIALRFLTASYSVTSFLEFTKTMNRGISWGLLNGTPEFGFQLITLAIAVFCALLIIYSWYRAKAGHAIWGEVLVIAGGLSNLADRLMHDGVIDFILISWGEWSWPVFNLADAAIVIGAGLMMIESFGGTSK
jgi:signal peptidase II